MGRGSRHRPQSWMRRDLRVMAAPALPLSAILARKKASAADRAGELAASDRSLLSTPTSPRSDPFRRVPSHQPSEEREVRLPAILLHQQLGGHPRDLQTDVRCRRDFPLRLQCQPSQSRGRRPSPRSMLSSIRSADTVDLRRSRGGGTADTMASKAIARKRVRVQIPPPAPRQRGPRERGVRVRSARARVSRCRRSSRLPPRSARPAASRPPGRAGSRGR
jgi:hypothetical protein